MMCIRLVSYRQSNLPNEGMHACSGFASVSACLLCAGMKPGISHEARSEPAEILYRQLFRVPGHPAPHLLPDKGMTARGAFNLTKGQAFVSDLLLTGETAVANLTEPQAKRCDALALDGGPGGHPKVCPSLYIPPQTKLLAHTRRLQMSCC